MLCLLFYNRFSCTQDCGEKEGRLGEMGWRVSGVYPSSLGVKAGSQPRQAASLSQGLRGRQTTICIHSYGQLAVPGSPHVHVFGLWGEVGVPGENPLRHRESKQSAHFPRDVARVHLIVSHITPICAHLFCVKSDSDGAASYD